MPTGLEEVHAVTDRALKQLDQDARRLNRQLNETREDIVKAKAQYEQVVSEIESAKAELSELKATKALRMKEIDTHRDEQIQVMEVAGKKLEERAAKIDAAAKASADKEQKAQVEVSKLQETKGQFYADVKKLHAAFNTAVEDLLKV